MNPLEKKISAMKIPFNFGKEISKMSINEEDFIEVPVTLKLRKNIAELAKILAICYSDYPTLQSEMLDKFLSKEVTKIVQSLAADPPGLPEFPDSFRQYIKDLLLSNDTDKEEDLKK